MNSSCMYVLTFEYHGIFSFHIDSVAVYEWLTNCIKASVCLFSYRTAYLFKIALLTSFVGVSTKNLLKMWESTTSAITYVEWKRSNFLEMNKAFYLYSSLAIAIARFCIFDRLLRSYFVYQ